jgi:pimeloyl-[acyl-carrier protein] methyl ester esterase
LSSNNKDSMKNVILLHGWAADSRIWQKQRESLEDRANLWIPDLPVWDVAWLQEKLNDFNPAATILVGWSLGGMLALEACAAGYRPRALLTIAVCASFCRRPDYSVGVAPAVVRGMRQRLQTAPLEVVANFQSQLLAPRERLWEEYLAQLLPQSGEVSYLSQGLEYLRTRDLREMLPRVEVESLTIVHGERDGIASAAQAYVLGEHLPQARLVLLPGAGHAPMISRSQQLNDLIAGYL